MFKNTKKKTIRKYISFGHRIKELYKKILYTYEYENHKLIVK